MSIEMLLMADVPELGTEGEVVVVSDGYARNFLLPKKLGAPVTPGMKRKLIKMQKAREERRKNDLDKARARADAVSKVSVTIPVKVAKEGKLYGAIHQAEIVAALKEQGVELEKSCIDMKEPIKELGVFDVKIKLNPEVETSIKVWVVEE